MSGLEARCRNCGNTGVDMFGKPCRCRYGKALPGLLDTIRNLRTNGTPEGVAEAIKRAGEAQLAAHVAAGGEVPPTIREMEQGMAEHEHKQNEQGQPSGVPMTAAELAAIRERAEAATPGPWERLPDTCIVVQPLPPVRRQMSHVTTGAAWGCDLSADADFIAAARTDIPALLADATYWRGKVEQAAARMREMEDEQARLLDIVRAVAKGPTVWGVTIGHVCNFCDISIGGLFGRTDHRANCPVTKARAVLAASQAAQTEAEA